MNRYKLSKAGINAKEGIDRFNGNADLYEKYLKKFLLDSNYKNMCESIKLNDPQGAFLAAHALKGVVGNLSMNKIYQDLIPLVEVLRGGSLENVDVMLQTINQDYEDIVTAIQ